MKLAIIGIFLLGSLQLILAKSDATNHRQKDKIITRTNLPSRRSSLLSKSHATADDTLAALNDQAHLKLLKTHQKPLHGSQTRVVAKSHSTGSRAGLAGTQLDDSLTSLKRIDATEPEDDVTSLDSSSNRGSWTGTKLQSVEKLKLAQKRHFHGTSGAKTRGQAVSHADRLEMIINRNGQQCGGRSWRTPACFKDFGLTSRSSTRAQPEDVKQTIASTQVTNWGVWTSRVFCPANQIAKHAFVRIEEEVGGDNTALNSIVLICDLPSKALSVNSFLLYPTLGLWGKWSNFFSCGSSGYITGFDFRAQPAGDGDQTAGNDLKIICNDGRRVHHKTNWEAGQRGQWTGEKQCGQGEAVCGFRVQFEPYQGVDGDNTALNNVEFSCCPVDPATGPGNPFATTTRKPTAEPIDSSTGGSTTGGTTGAGTTVAGTTGGATTADGTSGTTAAATTCAPGATCATEATTTAAGATTEATTAGTTAAATTCAPGATCAATDATTAAADATTAAGTTGAGTEATTAAAGDTTAAETTADTTAATPAPAAPLAVLTKDGKPPSNGKRGRRVL